MKYRLEMIDQMDAILEKRGLINNTNEKNALQSLFLVYDPLQTNWDYKKNIDIFHLLISKTLEVAKKEGFNSLYFIVYDHVSEEFIVDLFDFEVVETLHVNQYMTEDGVVPFHLVPDYVCGSVLYKKLN